VEVCWNDRHFILPKHVAGKILGGATRNLIVRGIGPNRTAEQIRIDLEHIHNLVVIDIIFESGDAILLLNSVHNALYARTCMMSRAAYKGLKIEFYPDECAQALPDIIRYSAKKTVSQPSAKKAPAPLVNRFQMLNMEGTEDDSDDEDGGIPNISTPHSTSNWSTSMITA
jgi:hypothetical protein